MRKKMEEKGIDFRPLIRPLLPALPRNLLYHKRYGSLSVCFQIFNSFAATTKSQILSVNLPASLPILLGSSKDKGQMIGLFEGN